MNKLRGHQNQKVLMQTLRVHPKYRGLKLAQSLAEFILQWISTNLPVVEIMRISTHYNNQASLLLHKKLGYTQKFTWGFFETEELEALKNILQTKYSDVNSKRKGEVINAEAVINEIERNREELVPSGVLVSNYFIVDASLVALTHLEAEQVTLVFIFL